MRHAVVNANHRRPGQHVPPPSCERWALKTENVTLTCACGLSSIKGPHAGAICEERSSNVKCCPGMRCMAANMEQRRNITRAGRRPLWLQRLVFFCVLFLRHSLSASLSLALPPFVFVSLSLSLFPFVSLTLSCSRRICLRYPADALSLCRLRLCLSLVVAIPALAITTAITTSHPKPPPGQTF